MNLQQAFARALLDPQQACPPGLISANGSDPALRFAVYRNNVLSSLVDALASTYPVVCQLVGEAFFRAMAQRYVQQSPPRSSLLVDYGADFADFVQAFAPAASLPYLADVARLELLRVKAYHSRDAAPVAIEQLAATLATPEHLQGLRLQLQPALAVLCSPYATVSLWAAHQGQLDIATVQPLVPQQALITRLQWAVNVQAISLGCASFISALQQDLTFANAAANGFAADPDFDLSASLALLIQKQAICALLPAAALN
jgi:hypothetical protein